MRGSASGAAVAAVNTRRERGRDVVGERKRERYDSYVEPNVSELVTDAGKELTRAHWCPATAHHWRRRFNSFDIKLPKASGGQTKASG